MRNIALIIIMMVLLAIGSVSLAFDVTVSQPGQNGNESGTFQTVEMQPVTNKATASVESSDTSSPVIAEKK